MLKEFKKSDLKVGMVVETRKNGLYFFIGDNLIINEDGWCNLADWNENLKYNSNIVCYKYIVDYEWDIIRVYKPNIDKICGLKNILNKECLELIWERNIGIKPLKETNKFENITDNELLEEVKRRFK